MNNLQKLSIWNKAIDLSTRIYLLTQKFPKSEIYGLQSQIRRCAVSIPSNISEGAGRNSKNEFLHFLGIANGSCFELQTQIIISKNLEYLSSDEADDLINNIHEIQKMNNSLMQKLKIESTKN
jgi:four helix bundle protein